MREEPLYPDEIQLFSRRGLLIKAGFALPVAGILWRLWDLQISEGDKYKELSKGNRIRLTRTPSPRGLIYDRNGVVMAKNIPNFNLMLVKEDCPDIPKTLNKLADTLRIPLNLLESTYERNKQGSTRFQPFQIYKDLTWFQMALVSSYQEEFPGVSVETSPRRYFPLMESSAHILGYMNRITKSQLEKLPIDKVMSAQSIGQDGVERSYNSMLIGTDGGDQVEVNSTGRALKRLQSIDPTPGKDLILTIDTRLQKEVERMLAGKKASCILMNPHNGEILALASLPGYDPNEFSMGISPERWSEIMNHPDHPLNNKCIQGTFSPGSTFKMAVALAALNEGVITKETQHNCEGQYHFSNLTIHCWNRGGHGLMNVTQAIENSCNIFFYKTANELGVEKIHDYANILGLGLPTGIDLYNEKTGVIPNKEWKRKRFKKKWFPGETLPVSIGQGYVTVTPIQLISYINIIANGGFHVKPRLVRKVMEVGSNLEEHLQTEVLDQLNQDKTPVPIDPQHMDTIRQAMKQNIHGARGTGRLAASRLFRMAGKTGTTQVVSNRTKQRLRKEKGYLDERFYDHAWFVGFAPAEDPKISCVLLLENGQAGANAAYHMRGILEYYFTQIAPLENMGRPQPVEPPPTPKPLAGDEGGSPT